MLKTKKCQVEVITTVLLILVAIIAFGIVASFVIDLVRNNLKGTDCFNALGKLSVNVDDGWTFFNPTNRFLYVNIDRSEKEFNISGLTIVFSVDYQTQTVKIVPGVVSGVYPADNITNNPQPPVLIPATGLSYTYAINISKVSTLSGNITEVSVAPIASKQCKQEETKKVPLKN